MIELLKLPYYLLISLGIGYIGYWTAYHGQDFNKEEKIFKILVFSAPSLLVLSLINNKLLIFISIILLSILSFVFGLMWRTKYRNKVYKILNKNNISNEDNYNSVLDTIMSKPAYITQIMVGLKDGRTLYCKNVYDYEDSAVRRFLRDKEGNFALYVENIDGEKCGSPKNSRIGDVLTYIPRSEIKYIDFRMKK